MVKAGVSTLKDLIYLRNVKPDLFEDIRKLKESVANRTSTKEFRKFKNTYPELFDGTLRKFNRSKVKNVLAQIRRAYNHGKQSKIPIHVQSAIQLENSYKGKTIGGGPVKPPINRFDWILSLYGRGSVVDRISYYQTTISNPDLIFQNPAILDLPQNDINFLTQKGVKEWRIIVKVKLKRQTKGKKTDYGYVSSKYVPLWDNLSLKDQLYNIESYIIAKNEYEWLDITAVVDDCKTIFLNWR